MSRSIKRISHDLEPMIYGINKLNDHLKILLPPIFAELASKSIDTKNDSAITACLAALRSLEECAQLAKIYIQGVDAEADREGIEKDDFQVKVESRNVTHHKG